jgi:hypothetical protein
LGNSGHHGLIPANNKSVRRSRSAAAKQSSAATNTNAIAGEAKQSTQKRTISPVHSTFPSNAKQQPTKKPIKYSKRYIPNIQTINQNTQKKIKKKAKKSLRS